MMRGVLAHLREGLVRWFARAADNGGAPIQDPFAASSPPSPSEESMSPSMIGELPSRGLLAHRSHRASLRDLDRPGDVRLTTLYDEQNLAMAVFSAMHEAGHASTKPRVDPELRRTRSRAPARSPARVPRAGSGRTGWRASRPYLDGCCRGLRDRFPGAFDDVDPEQLDRSANHVERSLIRIEADEVTYNLHILIRFELELELFEGDLELTDLPEAWNARYEEYLGLDVPDDATACCRTCTAERAFGYFPTTASATSSRASSGGRRSRSRRAALTNRRRRSGPRSANGSAITSIGTAGGSPRPRSSTGAGAGALGRAATGASARTGRIAIRGIGNMSGTPSRNLRVSWACCVR